MPGDDLSCSDFSPRHSAQCRHLQGFENPAYQGGRRRVSFGVSGAALTGKGIPLSSLKGDIVSDQDSTFLSLVVSSTRASPDFIQTKTRIGDLATVGVGAKSVVSHNQRSPVVNVISESRGRGLISAHGELAQKNHFKQAKIFELVFAESFIRNIQVSQNLTQTAEITRLFDLQHLFVGNAAHHVCQAADKGPHFSPYWLGVHIEISEIL